ncbi:uncharacterized membrane protein YcaP (DUF421 family) [Phycicoccus badiiscoriae]|uniref:Uncharacterized membrane protein YcaP (DUF421 family) n=1 Tax=Pedococcus badiiscoriae TaxID=642776 RepID=A0A852WDS5_9MICO|nr:uncharacterized membrane protein YcaP (DUF421 family) [Pedococcus badiiscoriae]
MFVQLVAAAPQGVVDDLFHLDIPPAEKIIRTIAVYLGILLIIRIAGKRLMAQMNSQDLVVVLLLSNVVQNAIIGNDNSLVGGLLGAAVLVLVNAGLDRWSLHSPRVAELLDGRPTEVVKDGVLDHRALAHVGMSPEELNNAIQKQGADSLSEVQRVALEPGGSITVELRPESRAATIGDLRRAVDALMARLEEHGQAGAGS